MSDRDLRFACPGCQQRIACDPFYAGKEIECPTCNMTMLAPEAPSPHASPVDGGCRLNIDETRPALQGFNEYYSREIAPYLTSLKKVQNSARAWAMIVGLLGVGITILATWLVFREYGWHENTGGTLGTLLLVTVALASLKLGKLQSAVKGFLLLEVCRFFGFEYREDVKNVEDIGFEEFAGSGLLPKFERKRLEDHIRGIHNGVKFDLTECRLSVKRRDKEGHSHYEEVYHGILFRLAFPKRFRGRTLLVRDRGSIGNFFKGFGATGQRIKLEDPRFEKLFEVWGSDQIESRYLLTPTFMERIVELSNSIDSSQIEACFVNNNLLVSAWVEKDQFEGGGLFTKVADSSRVEELVNEICLLFDIIDTLQLTLQTRA